MQILVNLYTLLLLNRSMVELGFPHLNLLHFNLHREEERLQLLDKPTWSIRKTANIQC